MVGVLNICYFPTQKWFGRVDTKVQFQPDNIALKAAKFKYKISKSENLQNFTFGISTKCCCKQN